MNFGLTTILLIASPFLPPPPLHSLPSPALLYSALGQPQPVSLPSVKPSEAHSADPGGKEQRSTSRKTELTFVVSQSDEGGSLVN